MKFDELFKNIPEGFRKATEEDKPLVTLTFAQAFADYPYPIPSLEETTYTTHLKFFYGTFVDQVKNGLEKGIVLTNEDYSAVIIVTPVEDSCYFDLERYAKNMREYAPEEQVQNMLGIMYHIRDLEKNLKFKEGTLYVEAFAVQTPRQGQKLGSALMRMLFEQCKKDKRDIFLFTNTQRNADIYEHLGYETILHDHSEELNSDVWFMLYKS